MPRHSSYRANHGIESVGNDWSSSQLIIGIAVAIVFGVTCFATGYVIAIYDNPLEPIAANNVEGAQVEPVPAPSTPGAAVEADVETAKAPPATTSQVKSETTPPIITAPATESAPPETEPAKPSDTVQRSGLRPPAIEALPAPGGPTPMVRTPVDLNKAPTPVIEPMDPDETTVAGITPPPPVEAPETVASNVPAVGSPTEKKPEPPTDTTAKKPEVTPPVTKTPEITPPKPVEKPPAPKPVPVAEKPATPTVTKGSFGIQVASFDGPQRSAQAKEFQRNIKAKAQQDSEIVIKDNGNYHTVVVPGFDTREAARAACEKMKSKPGLEGAWVVRLP